MKLNPNFTIFILFFGVALVEAIQSGRWLSAILFVLLGIMFLRTDKLQKKK